MSHLKDHGLNYVQHLALALKYAVLLGYLSAIAVVHGFLPFVFKTVVSRNLTKLTQRK